MSDSEMSDADGEVYEDEQEYSDDQYKPGSIVRVTMENFVTYTKATFYPGPFLNMVIGPNGTGKSTLVCAICLGLGYMPAVLGRSKDVTDFIKKGTMRASVTIELKGEKGKANYVINRQIFKGGDSSARNAYSINGEASNQKKVMELMKKLYIQIDNLCQFLPQDRVVEFAMMTPITLLEKTEEAVCPPEVLQTHKELIAKGKELAEIETGLGGYRGTLDLESKKLERMEARVQRIIEREEKVARKEFLEAIKPVVEYQETKALCDDLAVEVLGLVENLDKEKKQQEPQLRALEAVKELKGKANEVKRKKRKNLKELEEYVKKEIKEKTSKSEDRIKGFAAKREAIFNSAKKRKEEMETLRQDIRKNEQRLARTQEPFDEDAHDAKVRALKAEGRRVEEEGAILKVKTERLHSEVQDQVDKKAASLQEAESLESVQGQKMALLGKKSRDTWTALQWVHKNKKIFKSDVYDPPLLSCTIKDPRFVDHFEATVGRGSAITITCTNFDDLRTLQKEFFGDKKAGIKGQMLTDVHLRCVEEGTDMKHPITRDELESYGFDGWISDYVKGPPPVLKMMARENGIDITAVSLKPLPRHVNKELENRLSRWFSGHERYNVTRRGDLGAAGVITGVSKIFEAQLFNARQVDTGAIRSLRQKAQECEENAAEGRKALQDLKAQYNELNEKLKEVHDGLGKLKDAKEKYQKAKSLRVKIQANIENFKHKLQERKNDGQGFRERMAKSKKAQRQLVLELAANLNPAVEAATAALTGCQYGVIRAELRHVEAASEEQYQEDANAESIRRVKAMEVECEERKRAWAELKEKGKRLKKECKAIANKYRGDPERVEDLREVSALTLEELEEKIDDAKAQLAALPDDDNDPALKNNYDSLKAKVAELTEKVARQERQSEGLKTEIDRLQGDWEPRVREVVQRISVEFSESFRSINCAGEVAVRADEESFEKWAIEIRVTFRQNEDLKILDSHRQSGGERAVSTIFYLMALQSLARAPFRVVDEINQGMDSRNEKMVHARMVEIACQTHTSQYFLITPKLLPGLQFHERMKVHCINSGDYVTDGTTLMLEKYFGNAF